MKLLLLGSGGREHALAWKIAQSQKIEKLFIAPGNAGTVDVGENVPLKADDFVGIKDFVLANGIDMVVVEFCAQNRKPFLISVPQFVQNMIFFSFGNFLIIR